MKKTFFIPVMVSMVLLMSCHSKSGQEVLEQQEVMYTQIFWGILALCIFIVIFKSIKIPKASTGRAIMLFGKFYKGICNIEGKIFNHDAELVNRPTGTKKRLNIYFFLWPIWKDYYYPFSYTKTKKIGEEEAGDIVVWKNEQIGECIVVRKGMSNHVRFRVEYPSVTSRLDTKELASVNVITTNVIELTNISKMLFGIDNWFVATMSKIDATLKGLVSKKNLVQLNRFSSEDKGKFSSTMFKANEDETDPKTNAVIPGLGNYGVKLYQSSFRDFDPADEPTKKLMEATLNVSVFKTQGEASFAKQEGESKAYELRTNTEIAQEKKRRVETGIAKTDAAGNITELVPEADTKVIAESIAKLSDLQGTLVLGKGTTQMLNITKK